jgi:hypothetical protein
MFTFLVVVVVAWLLHSHSRLHLLLLLHTNSSLHHRLLHSWLHLLLRVLLSWDHLLLHWLTRNHHLLRHLLLHRLHRWLNKLTLSLHLLLISDWLTSSVLLSLLCRIVLFLRGDAFWLLSIVCITTRVSHYDINYFKCLQRDLILNNYCLEKIYFI